MGLAQTTENREPQETFVSADSDCQKTFGSVGAMAGALTGRAAISVGGALLAGLAVGATGLGVAAVGLGAVLGLALGTKFELASKTGRLLGGLVGGAAGTVAGWGADRFGLDVNPTLAQECKGFSVSSLPAKLLNPNYTSHPKLGGVAMQEGIAAARPGDVLITNNDNNFKLELMQKVSGATGDWTHAFLVDENGGVIDILQEDNTPRRTPIETAFTENQHLKILRPAYESQESVNKTLDWSREQFGKISYDSKFDLSTKDAMYCQEYIFNALEHGAPEIQVQPRKVFGFKDVVLSDEFAASPDLKEVWSTGSNFWLNWLSHFN